MASRVRGWIDHDDTTDKNTNSRIFIVNADDSGLHDMGLPTGTPWGDPDWSPDGSRSCQFRPIDDFNVATVEVVRAKPDGSD